ncbi:MAG: nicotinate (nicotinamide) nucleotide adenylyltransferase [Sulfurimonadaceae bacterium]|nr:nicotinate (nicotinamide) nucleotide adenylyltransferase [Sulfurimonadaceae bacterium]
MKQIALFGGSFDPPHVGHLAIVDKALEQLDIDRLVIVPAYLNPFKTHSFATAEQRLKWLKRIYAGNPKIEISDFEIARNRPVPSIETVRHYLNEAENIYLIIGADNVASLEKWYAYEELDRLVTWVVARRDGIEIPGRFITLDIDKPVSSTDLRNDIEHTKRPDTVADEIAAYYKETNARKN